MSDDCWGPNLLNTKMLDKKKRTSKLPSAEQTGSHCACLFDRHGQLIPGTECRAHLHERNAVLEAAAEVTRRWQGPTVNPTSVRTAKEIEAEILKLKEEL